MGSIRYRAEVDGLRAVAILPVIIFHLCPSWLPGGFVGVDVFFVISGYLITSIILAELASTTFSLQSFWERRVRRIMPAMSVSVLAVMLAYLILRVPPEPTASLGRQALRVASFTANHFMSAATGDYWGPVAEGMPLLHTWSLAVEEQFYLFFPLLLWLGWRWLGRERSARWLLVGVAALATASLVACLLLTPTAPSSAFFLLPFRAWELAAGALIAFVAHNAVPAQPSPKLAWLADLGAVLILIAVAVLDGKAYPGWRALLPVGGASLYVAFAVHGGLCARLLASRPAVYIGKASYSLYLWHWPALVLGGMLATLFELPVLRTASLALGLILAVGSYHLVEPLGRRTRHLFLWASGLGVTFVLLAAYLTWRAPLLSPPLTSPTAWNGVRYECLDVPRQLAELRDGHRFDSITVSLPDDSEARMRPVLTGPRQGSAQLVILGDSHGMMWASLIHRFADENGFNAAFMVASAVPPFLKQNPPLRISDAQRIAFNRMRMDYIATSRPQVVIICARWDSAAARGDMGEVDELVRTVRSLSPSTHIVLIGQPPMLAMGDQNAPQWLAWRSAWGQSADSLVELSSSDWIQGRDFLRQYAAANPSVTLIEVADLYRLPTGRVLTITEGHSVYTDDDHLSDFGASLAASRISTVLSPLLTK